MNNALRLTPQESLQIDICRVLCIYFMIGVHVWPGTTETTIIYEGDLHWFWLAYVDFLGRASVATLSFISGYVFFVGARNRPFRQVAASRFQSIYLPMVFWNVVYAVMVLAVTVVTARDFGAELDRYGITGVLSAISSVTALYDRSINIPLSFLRDLFVTMLILRIIAPWIRSFGIYLLPVLIVLACYRVMDPVILRPAVFLFAFLGALAAAHDITLTRLSSLSRNLPWVAGITGVFLIITYLLPFETEILQTESRNLLKRAGLVLLILPLSAWIAGWIPWKNLAAVRPVLFTSFLAHGVFSRIWGQAARAIGLDLFSWGYAVYFVLHPPVAFFFGWVISTLLDRLPRWMQLLVRGTARG